MGDTPNRFVIKLLSASGEVGLRRLRSYAASIGGSALIYTDYNKLIYDLNRCESSKDQTIVIYDESHPLSETQLGSIQEFARVFLVSPPRSVSDQTPHQDEACWQQESYMQCTLPTVIDSPVIRVCMAQLCRPNEPIQLDNLLRWGYAHTDWQQKGKPSLSETGHDFIRKFNLVGEWRRLTEMFCHFVTARSATLHLPVESVRLASDGLLLAAVARCRGVDQHPRRLIDDLRMHSFPIVAVNQRSGGDLEFAAFYTPFHPLRGDLNSVVLTFNKEHEEAEEEELEKVG